MYNFLVYICIIYLHVIEACLKVTIAIFYFYHSKNPSNIMKNIVINISSPYILEKDSLSTNIRNKCVIRKINLHFFDVMKNGQIFPSNVCHFHYDPRFLFSREMGNIRTCKEVRLQKLIKFRLSG